MMLWFKIQIPFNIKETQIKTKIILNCFYLMDILEPQFTWIAFVKSAWLRDWHVTGVSQMIIESKLQVRHKMLRLMTLIDLHHLQEVSGAWQCVEDILLCPTVCLTPLSRVIGDGNARWRSNPTAPLQTGRHLRWGKDSFRTMSLKLLSTAVTWPGASKEVLFRGLSLAYLVSKRLHSCKISWLTSCSSHLPLDFLSTTGKGTG